MWQLNTMAIRPMSHALFTLPENLARNKKRSMTLFTKHRKKYLNSAKKGQHLLLSKIRQPKYWQMGLYNWVSLKIRTKYAPIIRMAVHILSAWTYMTKAITKN